MESSDILAPLRNEDDYQQRMGTLYRRTINQTTTVIQMPLNAQKLVTPTPSDHISQREQYFSKKVQGKKFEFDFYHCFFYGWENKELQDL